MSMTHAMTRAETLAELHHQQPQRQAHDQLPRSREQRTRRGLRRAVRARPGHPVPPAETRRETRRQADHLPRQQRAVPRRVLGRHARRHRARAGGAGHQRRAQAQTTAHREEARQALHLHGPEDPGPHREFRGSRRRAGHLRRPRLAGLLRRVDRRHLARRPGSRGQARRHGLHPVLVGLDQRAQGRGAHASQHPHQLARRGRSVALERRTTSISPGCR